MVPISASTVVDTTATDVAALAALDEPITLEGVYNLLAIVAAQLSELIAWKNDVEQAMQEVQSSGMMGMLTKFLR